MTAKKWQRSSARTKNVTAGQDRALRMLDDEDLLLCHPKGKAAWRTRGFSEVSDNMADKLIELGAAVYVDRARPVLRITEVGRQALRLGYWST